MSKKKILQDYKDVYYNMHGKYPKITQKGSWMYINDSFSSHRISSFPGYTKRLIELLNKKKEYENNIRVFKREIKTCEECPNISTDQNGTRYECRITGQFITWMGFDEVFTIPSKCLLPKKGEANES